MYQLFHGVNHEKSDVMMIMIYEILQDSSFKMFEGNLWQDF